MIGVSPELEIELRERFTEEEIARYFGPYAHLGELRIVYDRGNGDRTSPLPSSRHMQYLAKGCTAVALEQVPTYAEREPIELPPDLAAHGEHDRVGVWQRGDDQLLSSCRNALSLLGKGWSFVGLANPERLRAISMQRPGAENLPLLAK